MKTLPLFLLTLAASVASSSAQLVTFSFPANTFTASSLGPNINSSAFGISTGTISTSTAGSAFPSEPYATSVGGWTATTQDAAKYFSFTINAEPGFTFSITNIAFRAQTGTTGPTGYGLGIGLNSIFAGDTAPGVLFNVNQSVTGQSGFTTAEVRIQGWLNGSRISPGDAQFNVDDIVVSGVVTAVPEPHEYAVAIAGLLGLLIVLRRKKASVVWRKFAIQLSKPAPLRRGLFFSDTRQYCHVEAFRTG